MYERPEDAAKAIEEYNNAQLDERVLTVELDIKAIVRAPKLTKASGKTLRVGGRGTQLRR